MDTSNFKNLNIIEACLLTATNPLTINQLSMSLDDAIATDELQELLDKLQQKYATSGIELVNLANGYRFRSRIEYQPYINKLYATKPPKYPKSVMETLAIIAYKQPVTRGDIESIRGVTVNSTALQTLTDRGWVEVIGHKPVPGKPELLATTTKLLEDLNLNSLQDLPPLITETTTLNLIEDYNTSDGRLA